MPASGKRPVPGLVTITASFLGISAVVAAVMLFVAVNERVKAYQAEALRAMVVTRANGVQTAFAYSLFEEWQHLKHVAQTLDTSDVSRTAEQLDTIVADGHRVSWGGYVRTDGIVLAASGGLLQGVDVSSRPWIQQGLERPYAGDVHGAKLLASLLPGTGGEPLRLMDLAMPVEGADGPKGVLGLHLNFAWAQKYLRELAHSLSIDVLLINREGTVLVATDGVSYGDLDVASVRAARAGVESAFLERWPDGKAYFSASVPGIGYGDLPSFGWSLVARIPADTVFTTQHSLSSSLLFYLAGFGLILLLLSALFIQAFIRPFAELARNAVKVAEGREVFPYQSSRARELQLIGAVLAKLQLAAFGSRRGKDG
jgi:hypothetical protein